ncbi:MetS family NSS transporter small subunit [Abyssisolibacter fermentans]|nr:MetS family NSS transporter small subunit [Abyssisolibacter fermentans]
MSTSAIVFGVIAVGLLWGGFAVCLGIAIRGQKK